MKPKLLVVACFILLICHAFTSFGQKYLTKEAEAFMKGAMSENHIPGLAFAVVKDGKVIQQGLYGKSNLSWNNTVDAQTVFQTASCSKLFTALLLGRLFDEKVLLPNQTMGELLDTIPYYWKPITIQQLASHQSGIWIADFGKAKNAKEAFELAKKERMEYEPGTRSFYVSSDYWILQYIIEKKTGLGYFEALKKYVLDPLGMQHTFVNNNDDSHIRTHQIIPKEAQVYSFDKNSKQFMVSDMQFGKTGYTAGGVYTSIEDMAKIAQTLDEGKFLTAATQKLLLTPSVLNDGKDGSFGIGLICETYQGYKISGHSGGPALADFVRFNDQKITFIVMSNQRGFYPYLAKGLATFYLQDLKMPQVPKPL
jgi:CubicO group peptidase (beta-lactamase class C family)